LDRRGDAAPPYSPECVEVEFSEVRPQESRLLSGGRHRRGVAQQQLLLRGKDDRRVHTLHPPKLRRLPLLDRLLYGQSIGLQYKLILAYLLPDEIQNFGPTPVLLGRRTYAVYAVAGILVGKNLAACTLLHGCCTRVQREFSVPMYIRHITCKEALFLSGRCWVRTSDLCRVKAALSR
jgi:hypothetical protein